MQKKQLLQPKPSSKSDLHRSVHRLLKTIYPGFTVKEEEYINVGGQKLFVDLVVIDLKACIECHGIQHFEFNPHFFSTKRDFEAQQRRDEQKRVSIVNAGYAYVVVRYDEYKSMKPHQLARRINKAIKESMQ